MEYEYQRLFVTGDTHGEIGRFGKNTFLEMVLKRNDVLFIAGDFGFVWNDSKEEQEKRKMLASKKYTICFLDGNHENFHLLNQYPEEEWCGGKAQVIERDEDGIPKVIHLMRGQVYEVAGKKIFTMGGASSIDRYLREEGKSWWPEEMTTDEQHLEALKNLEANGNKVDYILTHAARELYMETMFGRKRNEKEKPLNNFLQYVFDSVEFKHWYFGHLHEDRDLSKKETVLWFEVRNMETNECI